MDDLDLLPPPPAMPMPAAAPMAPAPGLMGGGMGTLQKVMPLILAGIAAKQGGTMGAGAMLAGFRDAMNRRRQMDLAERDRQDRLATSQEEREWRRRQYEQQERERGARFLADAQETLSKIVEPAARAHALKLYEDMAVQVFNLPPGTISGMPAPPMPDTSAKDTKDARDVLEAATKTYTPEEWQRLVQMNATIPFHGKQTPVQQLMSLAGVLATDDKGAAVVPALPKPKPETPKYDEAWYIGEALNDAQAGGRTLTPADRRRIARQARAEYTAAGRAPKDPDDPSPVDRVGARQADLWRENELSNLERRRQPGEPSIYGPGRPGISDEDYRREIERIERGWRRLREAAGAPVPEAAPAPVTPARMISPGAAERGTPPAPRAATPTASPAAAAPVTREKVTRESVQPGRIVVTTDGRRVRITRVNPDGSFETEPVR